MPTSIGSSLPRLILETLQAQTRILAMQAANEAAKNHMSPFPAREFRKELAALLKLPE